MALPILLVVCGQSNAIGNNNTPTIEGSWATAGLMWAGQGSEGYDTDAWVTSAARSTDTARYCCGVALQNRLAEFGRTVAFVNYGEGSTTMSFDWAAPPDDGAKALAEGLDACVVAALADGSCPIDPDADYRTLIVWRQGESDADNEVKSLAYEAVFGDFVTWIEARTWCKNPHWFVFLLHSSGTPTYRANVRAGQAAAVAASSATMTAVDTDTDSLTDGLHYDAPTRVRQGIRVAGLVRDMGL
jgi:hypothetical protein